MQDHLENNAQKSAARSKKQKRFTVSVAFLLVLLVPVFFGLTNTSCKNTKMPPLVIRVDDIQDFAFKEGQLFLFNESLINQVPLSLAVIAGAFGNDGDIVPAVKLALSSGSEVTVHGWEHEDIATLSLTDQEALLSRSRSWIKKTLDYDTSIFVPPMYSFNEDTITAMGLKSFTIISSSISVSAPGLLSDITSLPATVELSDFYENVWSIKSIDTIKTEISASIEKYGFAIIVTHPQEFLTDGKLDQSKTEVFRTLLITLKMDYTFETLKTLGKNLPQ
jgi:hypothetical protein